MIRPMVTFAAWSCWKRTGRMLGTTFSISMKQTSPHSSQKNSLASVALV